MLVVAVADAVAPRVSAEAERLAGLPRPVTVLAGEDATVARVEGEIGRYPIVHLACHGVYRGESPGFSRLRFADRWLTAAEVTELRLSAALVTLSACESGRSDGSAVEPTGLAWAFLAAGASDTIVSHWRVDDAVTAELMGFLYDALGTDPSVAHALRQARRRTATLFPHPFHWAGFSHVASSGTQPFQGTT